MKNIQLPKRFFEDNPLDELSVARISYVRMTTIMIDELENTMNEIVLSAIDNARRERYEEEKECIINLNKAEDIVSYMRKIKESSNRGVLLRKALEYQDEVVPLVLKKICTSGHDVFIENAVILLANADEKYTEQLYEIFPDIRNAYARSEVCIIFGIRKKKEYTPLLLDQFRKIREERPEETYEQGPLLALYLIYEKY